MAGGPMAPEAMTDEGAPSAFRGSPGAGRPRDRRAAVLAMLLLASFLGVTVAKPWGGTPPTPSGGPSLGAVGPAGSQADVPIGSRRTGPAAAPSVVPVPAAGAGALPVAFSMPAPPTSSAWSGFRWRRLAPGDPLSLVTSVVSWSHGYVGVGRLAVPPSTPVWTSDDGSRWAPVPFGAETTFWRGLAVLGVVERPAGLVAITETMEYCDAPCTLSFELPVVSWTSPDARTWTAHVLPPEWLARPQGVAPLSAIGPAGLVVASRGSESRLATSTDGAGWRLAPADAFPAGFALADLRGTATGYVAVGTWTSGGAARAASLWSADGRHWPRAPTLLPAPSGLDPLADTEASSLVAGGAGLIASGQDFAFPGATRWWQSADGRHWQPLTTFGPLGTTSCTRTACRPDPGGTLVGDGQRLVAVRGGTDARAWVSMGGGSWKTITMSGDVPPAGAVHATLVPAGLLLSDGTTTWLGEATAG